MDIQKKIKEMMADRGWTNYRLCKESGLSASTVANMFNRNNSPTLPTLDALCRALGITLSQFFAEDNVVSLTEKQLRLLSNWGRLSEQRRKLLLDIFELCKKSKSDTLTVF